MWPWPIFVQFVFMSHLFSYVLTIDRNNWRQFAYECMLHYSLTVHTDDLDIDLATDPEVLQVIDGYEWNELDVQHVGDFLTFS